MSKIIKLRDFSPLEQKIVWGNISGRFSLSTKTPPSIYVSNVSIVPYLEDAWVVIRLSNGKWEMPGGTLEPNEDFMTTLKRELLEEVGANLIDFNIFGNWHYISSNPQPFRPHLPHPEFYRVVGWGKIRIVGMPTNPLSGEEVVTVEALPLEEACKCFLSINRPELAALYRIASKIREGYLIDGLL